MLCALVCHAFSWDFLHALKQRAISIGTQLCDTFRRREGQQSHGWCCSGCWVPGDVLQTMVGTSVMSTRPAAPGTADSLRRRRLPPASAGIHEIVASTNTAGGLACCLACCLCTLLHRFQVRSHPRCHGRSCSLPCMSAALCTAAFKAGISSDPKGIFSSWSGSVCVCSQLLGLVCIGSYSSTYYGVGCSTSGAISSM